MKFEKITLFSNNISREFEIFTKLGFECIEQNKAYYKYILNETLISINNRQKGVFTNYLLKFEIDNNSFEFLKNLKFDNYKVSISNQNDNETINSTEMILIESNDNNGFIFQFAKSNDELQFQNENLKYKLISINCKTTFQTNSDTNNSNEQNKNGVIENGNIIGETFNINLNSDNQKLSENTPISILIKLNEYKDNMIFSGKGLVVTKI